MQHILSILKIWKLLKYKFFFHKRFSSLGIVRGFLFEVDNASLEILANWEGVEYHIPRFSD